MLIVIGKNVNFLLTKFTPGLKQGSTSAPAKDGNFSSTRLRPGLSQMSCGAGDL